MHTWMPLVDTHTNTHALTHIEHKSICVWICVSLELSAGISIDHLTQQMESDRQVPNKACLIVCLCVCVCACREVGEEVERQERVSVCEAMYCMAKKKKEKRRKIKIHCKFGLHHRFHICKRAFCVSAKIKMTITLDLRAATGCHAAQHSLRHSMAYS